MFSMENKKMPSIKQLFLDSWEAFGGSFGNVFVLSLLGSIFGLIVFGITFMGVAGLGFMSVANDVFKTEAEMVTKLQTLLTVDRMTQIGILMALFMFIGLIWSSVLRLAVVAAIGKYKERITLGQCIKAGFIYLIPFSLMSLVASFLVIGSYFLLLIPGILVGLFLQYVGYEIVLGGKKWWGAVKGSAQIMSQNFGEVVLRMIVFYLGVVVLFYLPSYLISMKEGSVPEAAASEALSIMMLLIPVRFLLGLLIGFFSMVFSVVLYKQAKEATNEEINPGLSWIVIVSLVGWVIGAFMINSGVNMSKKFVSSELFKNQVMEVKNEVAGEPEKKSDNQRIEVWKSKMTPEIRTLYEQSQQKFVELRSISQTAKSVNDVKKVNDENIKIIKQALELEKTNPELWNALGDAYTWVSTSGTLEKALESYETAEKLDGDIWKYAYGTANVLQMLGRHDEAILKFQKVIRMEDNYGRAHIALGNSYKAVGVKDLAKQELNRGIEILSVYNNGGEFDVEILNARKSLGELE